MGLTLDFISSNVGLYRAMDLGRPDPPLLSSGYVMQTSRWDYIIIIHNLYVI